MEVHLINFDAEGQRHAFLVPEGVTTVGRHLDCNYQVPSANVSRRHFRITFAGDTVTIKDLGSSNGTFINERRIQESSLKAGDKLRAADITFTVTIDGLPADVTSDAPVENSIPEHAAVTESTGIEAHIAHTQELELPVQLEDPSGHQAVTDPLSALAAMSRERQQ